MSDDDESGTPLFPNTYAGGEQRLFLQPPVDGTRRRVDLWPAAGPDPIVGGSPPPSAGTPSPAPSPTPTAPATADDSAIVGTVGGRIESDVRAQRFWGPAALTGSLAVSGVMSVVDHGAHVLVTITPLLVVGAMLAIYGFIVIPALASAGAAPGRSHNATLTSPTDVPITRFRLASTLGDVMTCSLDGRIRGEDLSHGDIVRLRGRRGRDGDVKVRTLSVLATPSGPVVRRITVRRSLPFTIARVGNWAGWSLAVLEPLWVLGIARVIG